MKTEGNVQIRYKCQINLHKLTINHNQPIVIAMHMAIFLGLVSGRHLAWQAASWPLFYI